MGQRLHLPRRQHNRRKSILHLLADGMLIWTKTLTNEGFNVFRLPFLMERMVPNTLYGSANSAYLANYTSIVNYITNRGAWAIVDPHKHGLPSPLLRKLLMSKSYGRYYNNIITDTSGFQTFWRTVASHFAGNSRVVSISDL